MKEDLEAALSAQLLAMGDDELLLGHQDSEWCGRAPILEEDIAFANLALDELGHAQLWYYLLAELAGEDPEAYPDRLVFTRPWQDFRCMQLVELPRGDWAFSMLRQYLFDAAEAVRLEKLASSRYTPLAEVAARICPEESYHLRHTTAWVHRLASGTEESHTRMQRALTELWPYTLQLFAPLPQEPLLVSSGWLPDPAELQAAWQERVYPVLGAGGLSLPSSSSSLSGRSEHSPGFETLIAEMQSVARMDSEAIW